MCLAEIDYRDRRDEDADLLMALPVEALERAVGALELAAGEPPAC
jgi:hypothetical protein